ncbi:hypothetical protein Tco_1221630 [Tanacetum coccineum]
MPTESSIHAESPSLDAELALTDSQAGPNPGKQDEGQAGPNSVEQDEGQDRSNPGDAAESQPQSREPQTLTEDQVIIKEPASSTRTLSSLQNLEKELSFTNQFFVEKPQEEEPEKPNTKSEVQSMVTVPIHQDTSSVPPMTSLVIDLTMLHPVSIMIHAPLPTSTTTVTATTTTTSLPPPPPQPQQRTTDSILVSKAVNEIVTDAVDWAMQAPLRARFHLDEARKKKRKRRESPRTPPGSPHSQPPLPPPPAGASGAPGTSGEPGSSQLPPPPPPPPSTGTSGSAQQQGSKAPSSSKTMASTHQSMAWTTSDTRYESTSFTATQETSPSDDLMHDDSILNEQVHLSDDDDSRNDHPPKDNLRKDWWKPLPEEDRPATPEPAWTIPASNVSDVENNWASVLVSTYEPPAKNLLLVKIGDMTTFMNGYCQKVNKIVLTQADFEGQAYEVVKAFYPGVIHIQFQMEECHKMLTNQVDWTNPKGDQLEYLRYGSKGSSPALSISKIKATSYPDFGLELLVSEQMWINDVHTYDISAKYGISHWWFNRQKFYIDRHDSPSRRKEVRTHMRILNVIRIKAYSRYGYDYLSEIVLRRADLQEHTIAEKDFKNLYPSDFEDLNLLLLQGHLDHLPGSDKRMLSTAVKLWTRNLVIRQRVKDFQLGIESYQTQVNLTKPGWDAKGYEFKHDYTIIESPRAVVFPVDNNKRKIMRFNKIYKFSDGTLTRILEALHYRVKEFKIKRLNPVSSLSDPTHLSSWYCQKSSDTKVLTNEDRNPSRANIKHALGIPDRKVVSMPGPHGSQHYIERAYPQHGD